MSPVGRLCPPVWRVQAGAVRRAASQRQAGAGASDGTEEEQNQQKQDAGDDERGHRVAQRQDAQPDDEPVFGEAQHPVRRRLRLPVHGGAGDRLRQVRAGATAPPTWAITPPLLVVASPPAPSP